jgi:predicted Fe-S protein YdhL (DUF1289 family)
VVETTERKSKSQSIASLSPRLAWNLLTPEEQRLLLEYLKKVRERDANEKTHKEQEKMPIAVG